MNNPQQNLIRTRYRGVQGALRGLLIAQLVESSRLSVVLTPTQASARQLIDDLSFFAPNLRAREFPPWDCLPFEQVSPQSHISAQRLSVLYSIEQQATRVVVTTPFALSLRLLDHSQTIAPAFSITDGDELSKEELVQQLETVRYRRAALVQDYGEYSERGGVVDLFPPGERTPIRIEILAGVVQRIAEVDSSSQRTVHERNEVLVLPAQEVAVTQETRRSLIPQLKARAEELETPPRELAQVVGAIKRREYLAGEEQLHIGFSAHNLTFFDYLSQNTQFILEDEIGVLQEMDRFQELIAERYERLSCEHYLIPKKERLFLSETEFEDRLGQFPKTFIDHVELLDDSSNDDARVKLLSFSNAELVSRLRSPSPDKNPLAPLRESIERWRKKKYSIAFVVGSTNRADRLKRMLFDLNYEVSIQEQLTGSAWVKRSREFPMVILMGHLSAGASIPDEHIVFLSENELFGERSYRTGKQAAMSVKQLLGSLSQLKEDDYIVHADYGVGIYRGFVHKAIDGRPTDLIQLQYADSTLFLPLTNISKVQRFSAAEGQAPVVDKLSSQRWRRTKEKVKQSVLSLAGDLIRLYAARSIVKGWHFDPAGAEDERFADGFPYDETPDQRKAIEETLSDMASERPMDRLICGDVGFGKTEVALRAAYKAAQHSKQVAVLAPTTLLVEQHRANFENRFTEFPVRVGGVSRFYSREKNRETLNQLASGELDIVVGTHRLLQKDVQFYDLGLVIIDEEHRFGVKQKERLKQLRKQVDILTLTATPIPRTLHMSLLDLRSISLITTPPVDRRATRTYVATDDETLIRDAILRELQRGGQTFFVHNRVQSIALVTQELARLVPEARFEFAHGQMKETQLEQIMLRFLQKEIDVLVSTTIIESGIDIPNANTILVHRAETFGLAQLYQLRGRVGRSARQAYCYFLIPNKKKLKTEAQQRLRALQSLDELGLGFHLALRDLEIRGAGNLLGKEQSGNVLSVGFDLYMKILRDAVHHLTGEELSLEEVADPEVRSDLTCFIPEYYIPDISERLVLYQRFASLRTESEALELADELQDRFGPPPLETENLLSLMSFRGQLRKYGVDKADISGERIVLSFIPEARLNPEKLLELIREKPKLYRLSKGNSLRITDPKILSREPPEIFSKILLFLHQMFPELPNPR